MRWPNSKRFLGNKTGESNFTGDASPVFLSSREYANLRLLMESAPFSKGRIKIPACLLDTTDTFHEGQNVREVRANEPM